MSKKTTDSASHDKSVQSSSLFPAPTPAAAAPISAITPIPKQKDDKFAPVLEFINQTLDFATQLYEIDCNPHYRLDSLDPSPTKAQWKQALIQVQHLLQRSRRVDLKLIKALILLAQHSQESLKGFTDLSFNLAQAALDLYHLSHFDPSQLIHKTKLLLLLQQAYYLRYATDEQRTCLDTCYKIYNGMGLSLQTFDLLKNLVIGYFNYYVIINNSKDKNHARTVMLTLITAAEKLHQHYQKSGAVPAGLDKNLDSLVTIKQKIARKDNATPQFAKLIGDFSTQPHDEKSDEKKATLSSQQATTRFNSLYEKQKQLIQLSSDRPKSKQFVILSIEMRKLYANGYDHAAACLYSKLLLSEQQQLELTNWQRIAILFYNIEKITLKAQEQELLLQVEKLLPQTVVPCEMPVTPLMPLKLHNELSIFHDQKGDLKQSQFHVQQGLTYALQRGIKDGFLAHAYLRSYRSAHVLYLQSHDPQYLTSMANDYKQFTDFSKIIKLSPSYQSMKNLMKQLHVDSKLIQHILAPTSVTTSSTSSSMKVEAKIEIEQSKHDSALVVPEIKDSGQLKSAIDFFLQTRCKIFQLAKWQEKLELFTFNIQTASQVAKAYHVEKEYILAEFWSAMILAKMFFNIDNFSLENIVNVLINFSEVYDSRCFGSEQEKLYLLGCADAALKITPEDIVAIDQQLYEITIITELMRAYHLQGNGPQVKHYSTKLKTTLEQCEIIENPILFCDTLFRAAELTRDIYSSFGDRNYLILGSSLLTKAKKLLAPMKAQELPRKLKIEELFTELKNKLTSAPSGPDHTSVAEEKKAGDSKPHKKKKKKKKSAEHKEHHVQPAAESSFTQTQSIVAAMDLPIAPPLPTDSEPRPLPPSATFEDESAETMETVSVSQVLPGHPTAPSPVPSLSLPISPLPASFTRVDELTPDHTSSEQLAAEIKLTKEAHSENQNHLLATQAQNLQLQEQLAQAKQKNANLDAEITKLQEELTLHKQKLSQLKQQQKAYTVLEAEHKSTQTELEEIKKIKEKHDTAIRELRQQKTQLKQELEPLKKSNQELTSKLKQLEQQNEQLVQQQDELIKQRADEFKAKAQEVQQQLGGKNLQLTGQISALQDEKKNLQGQLQRQTVMLQREQIASQHLTAELQSTHAVIAAAPKHDEAQAQKLLQKKDEQITQAEIKLKDAQTAHEAKEKASQLLIQQLQEQLKQKNKQLESQLQESEVKLAYEHQHRVKFEVRSEFLQSELDKAQQHRSGQSYPPHQFQFAWGPSQPLAAVPHPGMVNPAMYYALAAGMPHSLVPPLVTGALTPAPLLASAHFVAGSQPKPSKRPPAMRSSRSKYSVRMLGSLPPITEAGASAASASVTSTSNVGLAEPAPKSKVLTP